MAESSTDRGSGERVATLFIATLRQLTGNRPHLAVVLASLGVFAFSYSLSFLLRFEFKIPRPEQEFMFATLPFVLLIKLVVFYVSGIYRILWAYVGIRDLFRILRTTAFASGVTIGVNFVLWRNFMAPRSVVVMDGLLTFLLIGGLYAVLRHLREVVGSTPRQVSEPVVIIGAGDAGQSLLQEIQRNPSLGASVIGFLDDSIVKQGHSLRGVPVLGRITAAREIAYRLGVRKAFVAIPSASGSVIRRIVTDLLSAGLAIKILPNIESTPGSSNASSFLPLLRGVTVEDLLRRDPIVLDDSAISEFIHGKVVLVTGAAGSIGSQLCRQIIHYLPARLIVLDCAESPLHDILLELNTLTGHVEITPEFADITNAARIGGIFAKHQPKIVFHAAGLKHVPMMERHPREAIRVNVGGTRTVATAAQAIGASAFVLISTDKAVNPSNTMGATKKIAETIVKDMSASKTRFMAVRFGNVLGSNGSVLRIFKNQLERGGPLTVTHPDMRRYFMTIPEAAQLVLQAAVLGKNGDILELEMGKPVRIVDLAEDLIRLSGLTPNVDIRIEFTGIRPGEKLDEELVHPFEKIVPTAHSQVYCIRSEKESSINLSAIDELCKSADNCADDGELTHALQQLARK